MLIVGLTLAVSTWTAGAQGGRGAGRGAANSSLPPLLASVFDADNDGVLSAAEISGSTAALMKLDANHDGRVDAAELCSTNRPGWGRKGGSCPATAWFDTDNDGRISAAEAQGAPAVLQSLGNRGRGSRPWCNWSGAAGAGRGCPRWDR